MVRALPAFCLAAAAVFAQDGGGIIFRQQFQADAEGWTSLGERLQIRVEPGGGATNGGPGRLIFSYERGPGGNAGAVLPAPAGLERARTIRFRLRSERATPLAVLFAEKKPGGGNYAAWFSVPAGEAQTVELTPADFTLTDGPGDPADPDGKLDLDEVEGIGIFDLTQFLPGATPADSTPNTLAIEDFEILSSPPAGPGVSGWIALGGMKLKPDAGGVSASYDQSDNPLQILVRRVAADAAAGAKRISFDVAASQECTLLVSLEMKKAGGGQGPRFTLTVYPPGNNEAFHVDLKLADFQGDGKFDPAKWRSLAIVGVEPARNSFRISNLKVE